MVCITYASFQRATQSSVTSRRKGIPPTVQFAKSNSFENVKNVEILVILPYIESGCTSKYINCKVKEACILWYMGLGVQIETSAWNVSYLPPL